MRGGREPQGSRQAVALRVSANGVCHAPGPCYDLLPPRNHFACFRWVHQCKRCLAAPSLPLSAVLQTLCDCRPNAHLLSVPAKHRLVPVCIAYWFGPGTPEVAPYEKGGSILAITRVGFCSSSVAGAAELYGSLCSPALWVSVVVHLLLARGDCTAKWCSTRSSPPQTC